MASVSGSKLAFFQTSGKPTNVVLFDGTTFTGQTVPGAFNIEVFTKAAGTPAAGFDASAFVQGAVSLNGNPVNNPIQAASFKSTEQLLSGNFQMIDQTGNESITMGSGNQTVTGSAGDTITGGSVSGSSQLIDISFTNASVNKGPASASAIGGAGITTVWVANGDSVLGGSGPMLVAGSSANNMQITGGSGDLAVFNLGKGNTVTGSSGGFTFVGDAYPGGGGNTISGGASTVSSGSIFGFNFPASMVVIGGTGDLINGGAGTMLVNALSGGETVTGGSGTVTVWGGAGGAVVGGAGALQFNAGFGTKVTGGTGALNAFALGTGNTITGGSSSTNVINDAYGTGGNSLLIGGAGSSTIFGGSGDTINGGTGALEARILQGFGTETVNLSASGSPDGVRDVASVGGGTKVTVTGFNTTNDVIESATDVSAGGVFSGSSVSGPTGTTLTFADGNTMFIAGVVTPGAIKFTQ